MHKHFYRIFILLFCNNLLNAQINWTAKIPFEQKDFIENKGQFDAIRLPNKADILFVAQIDGLQYCFTKNGYTIQKANPVEKKQTTKDENDKIENEEEENIEIQQQFHELKFAGANKHVEIIAENKVSNYYSFSDFKNPKKVGTITANAFTKLIYKNLYPNIDLVFEFPKDTSGIKYSIYLYPGADVEQIKMFFPTDNKFQLINNNLEIESEFGKIIDHEPKSYTENGKSAIKSKFKIFRNRIGFELDNKNITETIVIDPWTVTPNFSGFSNAYDIDYDNNGNVYAFGGAQHYGGPFKLLKFSPLGTLIWTYFPTSFAGQYCYYGDFAVDRKRNTIYLVEAFDPNSGAGIFKINGSASVLGFFPGDARLNEMSRIAFDKCDNNAVIAGGGTQQYSSQTTILDTNLYTITPVRYVPGLNGSHDVGLLALDNYGNCYEETFQGKLAPDGFFENKLIKLSLPSMTPIYNVNIGYKHIESSSVRYTAPPSNLFSSNGYNGIATSNSYVYTYDSFVLKKWDGTNGHLLSYNRISYPQNNDSSQMYCGGIAADDCGNIFIANDSIVRQFDSSLNYMNYYAMNGPVTDIKIGNNGMLYVCGLGFVTSLIPTNIINCGLSITTTKTNASCTSLGAASVSISGGTPPYNVIWNTIPPQSGTSVSNLNVGTYTVQVKESSCENITKIDTVVIANSSPLISSPTINNGCAGISNGGSITINIQGGVSPFTYTWSNGLPNSSSVNGLAAGTYSLTITDNAGCTNSYDSLVIQPTSPISYSFNGSIKCYGDTTSLKITPFGGNPPYSVAWLNPVSTGQTVNGIYAGNYSGIIIDLNSCQQAFSYTVNQPQTLVASVSHGFNCSIANSGIIKINVSGGTGQYNYLWTGYPGNTSDSLTGLTSGLYSVIIQDSNNCSITLSDTLAQPQTLLASLTTHFDCLNSNSGSITANISGGTLPYLYSWTGFPTDTTNVLNGLVSGVYAVTIKDNNNCNINLVDTITAFSPISISSSIINSCNGGTNGSITINATGGTSSGYMYSWAGFPSSTGNILNNIASGQYVLDVSSGACNTSATFVVNENPFIDSLKLVTSYCEGEKSTTIFLSNSEITQAPYQWFDNGIAIPNANQNSFIGNVNQLNSFTVTWFNNGCKYATSLLDSIVYPKFGAKQIVNVFTPDGDGINDIFYPFVELSSSIVNNYFENYNLQIFDKWGNTIFETSEAGLGWNGLTKRNKKADAGVYFWTMHLKGLCDNSDNNYKGFFQLYR